MYVNILFLGTNSGSIQLPGSNIILVPTQTKGKPVKGKGSTPAATTGNTVSLLQGGLCRGHYC